VLYLCVYGGFSFGQYAVELLCKYELLLLLLYDLLTKSVHICITSVVILLMPRHVSVL
jgi:hypothetical protein